jgi:membrane associated rhomboid family serine protease
MRKTFKDAKQSPRSALKVLLWAMVLVFTINRISVVWFENNFLQHYLPLSAQGLRSGSVWQLVSHMFMHRGIWHIFGNAIVLFFIGKLIEERYGRRRLMVLFFTSGIIGGLLWLAVNFSRPYGFLIGASPGCLGIFSYFCLACENRPIILLLFFIIPVRIKPRMLLMIVTGLETFSFFIYELADGRIANSAHLGGILGGYLCHIFYHSRRKHGRIIGKKSTPKNRTTDAGDSYKLYITSHSAQRSEVDRILDKINESGFKSLTDAERDTLNSAKHLMRR